MGKTIKPVHKRRGYIPRAALQYEEGRGSVHEVRALRFMIGAYNGNDGNSIFLDFRELMQDPSRTPHDISSLVVAALDNRHAARQPAQLMNMIVNQYTMTSPNCDGILHALVQHAPDQGGRGEMAQRYIRKATRLDLPVSTLAPLILSDLLGDAYLDDVARYAYRRLFLQEGVHGTNPVEGDNMQPLGFTAADALYIMSKYDRRDGVREAAKGILSSNLDSRYVVLLLTDKLASGEDWVVDALLKLDGRSIEKLEHRMMKNITGRRLREWRSPTQETIHRLSKVVGHYRDRGIYMRGLLIAMEQDSTYAQHMPYIVQEK